MRRRYWDTLTDNILNGVLDSLCSATDCAREECDTCRCFYAEGEEEERNHPGLAAENRQALRAALQRFLRSDEKED